MRWPPAALVVALPTLLTNSHPSFPRQARGIWRGWAWTRAQVSVVWAAPALQPGPGLRLRAGAPPLRLRPSATRICAADDMPNLPDPALGRPRAPDVDDADMREEDDYLMVLAPEKWRRVELDKLAAVRCLGDALVHQRCRDAHPEMCHLAASPSSHPGHGLGDALPPPGAVTDVQGLQAGLSGWLSRHTLAISPNFPSTPPTLVQECPSGKLHRDEFVSFYKDFFPNGDASSYANLVYDNFDHLEDGAVSFEVGSSADCDRKIDQLDPHACPYSAGLYEVPFSIMSRQPGGAA